MRALRLVVICLLPWVSGFGQSTYLHLSEQEMQRITSSPEQVSAKIKELELSVQNSSSLPDRISLLQTIVLLEPYSRNSECELSRVYAQIAELMMQMDARESAIQLCHRTLFLANHCDGLTSVELFIHIGRLGSFHMFSHNLDSALYYFKIAANFSDTINDPIWHASAMNNLGMVWTELNEPDSAYPYFNQALFGLNSANPTHQRFSGNVCDNLAKWYFDHGNLKVASQFYKENIMLNKVFADTAATVNALLHLANIQVLTKSLDSAKVTLTTIETHLFSYRNYPAIKAKQMCEYYLLKKSKCVAERNFEGALDAADNAMIWQIRSDSIEQKTRQLMIGTLNHSELARVNQELALRNRVFQLEEQSAKEKNIALGIMSVLALTVCYLAYSRRKQKHS